MRQCCHIVGLIPFRGIFGGKWDLGIFLENLGFFLYFMENFGISPKKLKVA